AGWDPLVVTTLGVVQIQHTGNVSPPYDTKPGRTTTNHKKPEKRQNPAAVADGFDPSACLWGQVVGAPV
ncbi:MAG: hypothetical protein WBO84_01905, partial [Acidimicrobiia bacterium]